MAEPSEIWVADTSSLSGIRRIDEIGVAREATVLKKLERFVESGQIVYPKPVVDELGQYASGDKPFRPYEWAKRHKDAIVRQADLFETTKELLADAQIQLVVDAAKAIGEEEADPYVLALAVKLKREGHEVTVLTEERRDRPSKLSLNTACGLLRVYCLPVRAFLVQQGLLKEN